MREQIIFAPGLNDTELLRSLAAHGVNSLGMRVMGTTALAKHALMHAGVVVQEEFLTQKEKAPLIDSFVRSISYFGSASFADSENLAVALDALRSIIPGDEATGVHNQFLPGEFEDKNTAIVQVYDRYTDAVTKSGKIDSIMLVRKAIKEAAGIFASGSLAYTEIITLKEFPLKPLEAELLKSITGNEPASTDLVTLFACQPKALENISFLESYGPANEVEAILADVAKKNIPFDQCTVALADTKNYSDLFYEQSVLNDIPMTFGCGLPISNALPAHLLKLLQQWDTTGYHGIDALSELVFADATDRAKLMEALGITETRMLRKLVNTAGNLKLSTDEASNNAKIECFAKVNEKTEGNKEEADMLLKALKALSDVLAKHYAYFIASFAKTRPEPIGRIDRAAIKLICNELDAFLAYTEDKSKVNDLIPDILEKTVLCENSKEGALHITGLTGAVSTLRGHLFIAGMSAANFPGKPTENYLLLDSDYEIFGEKLSTSINIIKTKEEQLWNLLNLANALQVSVQLSFSSYNPAEISAVNISSILFEIYKKVKGEKVTVEDFENDISKTTYFAEKLAASDYIGQAFLEGKKLLTAEDINGTKEEEEENNSITDGISEPKYKLPEKNSPSSIEVFFTCPKQYYLKYIAKIPDTEEDDPFEIINAREYGTLAHSIMEELADNKGPRMTKEAFMAFAQERFADYLAKRPAFSEKTLDIAKRDFDRMLSNAYDTDPCNEVMSAEEEVKVEHESGVTLFGYPDRVEKDSQGRYLIADFKTKRKEEHIEDDIDTCLQVVIYAYIIEHTKKYPIDHCEYRYLRKGTTINCKYDNEIKQALADKLNVFKAAFETGEFKCNESEESCRYCSYADICKLDNPASKTQKEEE